ncbi:MAG: hypothetical protein C4527_09910 [Candidatus Omnitrophota bacterium]|jgi:hypothetical protein|nr:MAG: hypothetical protein C4527_09910 [Candidatus Omnitrophota bacterium]
MDRIQRQTDNQPESEIRWWQPVVFAALAGGMGWGIRGQYGHETGAMVPGLLVSLTLVFFMYPRASVINTARIVAWGAVAMGFGGSMTYGQTIGLTQNTSMIGNWAALGWGMLGLSIKGALWIGFAGAFLGMGFSGIRYRSRELLLLMIALVAAYFLGVFLLNSPFDPANQSLPAIYFSADWYWEPDAVNLQPRPECWGGLLFALIVLIVYTARGRKDSLAPRLASWGILGGVVGFPLGQCLQANHAWNLAYFKEGWWSQLDPFMNWWNMMETTFGAVMGGMLGLGLWLNRKRIRTMNEADGEFSPPMEWILLAVHLALLVAVEFMSVRAVDMIYDIGLVMGIIPIVAIAGGRWWPYLIVYPITLLPIAGKTVDQLVYQETAIAPLTGWFAYLIAPLLIATTAAIWIGRHAATFKSGLDFTRFSFLFCTWTYFLINFAFFRFPWPWADWTQRTPNGIIFLVCAIGLTTAALFYRRRETNSLAV